MLSARPAPTPVPVPVVVVQEPPAPKPMKEMKVAQVQKEIIPTRSNKWDVYASEEVAPVKVQGSKALLQEEEIAPVVAPVPVPVPVVVEKPKPLPRPQKTPVAAPAPVVPEPVVVAAVKDVIIAFPREFNHELSVLAFSKVNEDFKITVSSDIPLDDLLFELRKAVSTKVEKSSLFH